jgi:TetR/AcrR family transcriptional regulator, mexJK operon transcriptional repressor
MILDAAATIFLRKGYAGASVDEIAAVAGASKATIYRHFADKQTLFSELVATSVKATSDAVQGEIMYQGGSRGLEGELRSLARRLLAAVMRPEFLQLRRLIIGEASRFPTLGRVFYEQESARTVAALADLLSRFANEGQLGLDDPFHAASQLKWLIVAEPLNRAMLLGHDETFTSVQLEHHVDAAVRAFLAGHKR